MRIPPDVAPAAPARAQLAADSKAQLDYAHRRVGKIDVYFVRNGSSQTVAQDVLFRANGRSPELWDAVTGEMRGVAQDTHRVLPDGRVRVPLVLPPFGSMVVVFPEDGESKKLADTPTAVRSAALVPVGAWTVAFQRGRGAPDHPIQINALTSWTTWSEPGVRFFSGAATYRAVVTTPQAAKGSHVSIRFTDLHEVARVRINGRAAGTVWAKPLTLRVDPWLRKKKNVIEVEVTNLWPNRVIGDLQPGVSRPITNTNIKAYRPDSPLLPSGLIGPLEWVIEQ
jgi:hypothetical protein